MLLQGKVAPIAEQIVNKLHSGIDNAELQILGETDYDTVAKIVLDYPDMHINSVHTSLYQGVNTLHKDINLNHLTHPIVNKEFIETCKIASLFANHYGKQIPIILHCTMSAIDWRLHRVLLEAVAKILRDASATYDGICFSVENVTPHSNVYGLCNFTTPKDAADVCDLFRSLGVSNIYLTVDLCHLNVTNMFYYRVLKNNPILLDRDFEDPRGFYKDWFMLCGEFINNIHIASYLGEGNTHETHGTSLTGDMIPCLKEVANLTEMHCPNAMWTIEVQESCYNDCPNQRNSMAICKSVLNMK